MHLTSLKRNRDRTAGYQKRTVKALKSLGGGANFSVFDSRPPVERTEIQIISPPKPPDNLFVWPTTSCARAKFRCRSPKSKKERHTQQREVAPEQECPTSPPRADHPTERVSLPPVRDLIAHMGSPTSVRPASTPPTTLDSLDTGRPLERPTLPSLSSVIGEQYRKGLPPAYRSSRWPRYPPLKKLDLERRHPYPPPPSIAAASRVSTVSSSVPRKVVLSSSSSSLPSNTLRCYHLPPQSNHPCSLSNVTRPITRMPPPDATYPGLAHTRMPPPVATYPGLEHTYHEKDPPAQRMPLADLPTAKSAERPAAVQGETLDPRESQPEVAARSHSANPPIVVDVPERVPNGVTAWVYYYEGLWKMKQADESSRVALGGPFKNTHKPRRSKERALADRPLSRLVAQRPAAAVCRATPASSASRRSMKNARRDLDVADEYRAGGDAPRREDVAMEVDPAMPPPPSAPGVLHAHHVPMQVRLGPGPCVSASSL